MKVCLDSGHGGRDRSNRGPSGYIEADGTLAIAMQCRKILIMAGLEVVMTRGDDVDLCPTPVYDQGVDLRARAEFANAENADYFVSIHTNAASNANAKGTETFCYRWNSEGHKLAIAIQDEVVSRLGTTDRGVKENNFCVLRETTMPAVLVEIAFHTNPTEEAKLKDPDFLRKAGEAVAVGVIRHLGLPQPSPGSTVEEGNTEEVPLPLPDEEAPLLDDSRASSVMVNLMGKPQCAAEQAMRWARSRGATEQFVNLAPIYWKKGEVYGLRADVLYCQAAKETGFGRFGGAVTPDMHNFAGIKVKSPTGDARDDHETFPDDDTGVHAHFQHMAAYVGIPIVGAKTHARQDVVRSLAWAGTVKTVEGLGGKWAPNPDYGASIVRDYLTPLLHFAGFEDYAEMTPCAKCQEFEVEIAALKEKINRARHHIEDLLGML